MAVTSANRNESACEAVTPRRDVDYQMWRLLENDVNRVAKSYWLVAVRVLNMLIAAFHGQPHPIKQTARPVLATG